MVIEHFGTNPRAAQRLATAAWLERQYRQHTAEFSEPGEPACKAVLLRCEAGEKGRNCRCCRRRSHRCDRALQMLPKRAAIAVLDQVMVTQAINHQQYQVACFSQFIRYQSVKGGIVGERLSIGSANCTHQIDDTSATIIRENTISHY